MAKIMLKETVVQWITIDDDEIPEGLDSSELEEVAHDLLWEAVAANGWDGQDGLEMSITYEEE